MNPAAVKYFPESRTDTRDDDVIWTRFQRAMAVLRARTQGNGASDLVLAELLEDDLRQARIALHVISEFLDDAVDAVGDPAASAADVIDISDTAEALEACEKLEQTLPLVRRRLGQVALRLTRR